MSNHLSEVDAKSPSISNADDQPPPNLSAIHATMQNFKVATPLIASRKGEEGDSSTSCVMRQQQRRVGNTAHIPSPPIINNWHTMSTAATTITSNLHPRVSLNQPHMLPMGVPTHQFFPADVVVDDDIHNINIDTPPVCEIQIPSQQQRPKRRADIDDDCNYYEDDDADSTSSTQNLSRDDHQQYDAIDYKGMYFTSQRQSYALREQVQCVLEDNRRLKRQLIEMQKQLYTHSRNKRPSVSSLSYHHSNRHPYHGTGEVVPWSIPTSSTSRSYQDYNHNSKNHPHQQLRVLVARYPSSLNSNIVENAIVCPTTPTKATTHIESVTTASTPTTSPSDLQAIAPALTNGVSMSVSSEEGNAIL
jgi:hypothetical protein